jgi:hypothetical protein
MRRSALAVTLVLLAVLSACTPTTSTVVTGPRPITSTEAELLAVVRFKNFDAGTRTFDVEFRDAGTPLSLTGWVDYSTEVGYGLLSDSGTPVDLLLWDSRTLAASPITTTTTVAPLPPPQADLKSGDPKPGSKLGPNWTTATLTSHGALHPLLRILTALGNDRPDNPLLLQQGGALWLRTDTIGSSAVTVFAGPTLSGATAKPTAKPAPKPAATPGATVNADASNTRYWVTKSGLLLRLDVRLGAEWVTITFGPAKNVHLSNPFAANSK